MFLSTAQSIISTIITAIFVVEIPLHLYAFGTGYYYKHSHAVLHVADAFIILSVCLSLGV